jgi:aryl-alcohol dehydrogenase-like predicted oxidoreductase
MSTEFVTDASGYIGAGVVRAAKRRGWRVVGLARWLVAMAVERGVTLFDSAGRYQDGQAEIILGRAIAPYRDRVVISTKDPVLPASEAGPVAAQIEANVEASSTRLGVETIDLYQVGVSRLDQGVDDLATGFDAVVRRGLVRAVGVTNLPAGCWSGPRRRPHAMGARRWRSRR